MSAYFDNHHISNSDLRAARKFYDNDYQEIPNLEEIFKFGTLVHALLLEPHKADRSHPQVHLARQMVKTCLRNDLISRLLMIPDLKREHEFYRANKFGVPARCKADASSRALNICFEFKGLSVNSDKQFEEGIDYMGYDQAAAWYINVTERPRYIIAASSKSDPRKLFTRLVDREHPVYKRGVPKVKKAVKYLAESFDIKLMPYNAY